MTPYTNQRLDALLGQLAENRRLCAAAIHALRADDTLTPPQRQVALAVRFRDAFRRHLVTEWRYHRAVMEERSQLWAATFGVELTVRFDPASSRPQLRGQAVNPAMAGPLARAIQAAATGARGLKELADAALTAADARLVRACAAVALTCGWASAVGPLATADPA
ncbi:MAG TPA: hypothetical protein VFO85_19740, partial [Vicinamibacteria bacterium]|nr:hypothetical protein [Vicinamibacteria bacterium]